jgi:aminopeptidase Y
VLKSVVRSVALVTVVALVLTLAPLVDVPMIEAASAACDNRVNNTHDKLLECVTLEGVREHQAALQTIANANGGTRVSGLPGFNASKDYAAAVFGAAGYTVTVQPFQFQTFVSLAPSVLEQVPPAPAGPIANTILTYSGSGDVTAAVTALPAPPTDATPWV